MFLRIWSIEDYIVMGLLLFPILLIVLDHRLGLIKRLSEALPVSLQEEVVFLSAIVYMIMIFAIEAEYHLTLIFGGIVDYDTVTATFLYANVQMAISSTLLLGMILSPFACAYMGKQLKKSAIRFAFYGLIMNIYGILYFVLFYRRKRA